MPCCPARHYRNCSVLNDSVSKQTDQLKFTLKKTGKRVCFRFSVQPANATMLVSKPISAPGPTCTSGVYFILYSPSQIS